MPTPRVGTGRFLAPALCIEPPGSFARALPLQVNMTTDTQETAEGRTAVAADTLEVADTHGTAPQRAPNEHSQLVTSQRWRHAYGEMLIETRDDGTVWIDGKVVPDTLPIGHTPPAKPA